MQHHRLKRANPIVLVAAAVAAALALAGCSSLSSDTIDYKSVGPQRGLEVPPDLTQLPANDRYQAGVFSASETQAQRAAPPATAAVASAAAGAASQNSVAPDAEIAQLKREGSQRWLAVSVPPEKAYDVARAFWPSVGLALELEEPSLGIMETVWAENRAKLPQDVIRRTLGWALGSIYSTGEQDKFRTRIERTPKNTSEIFISHRGMIEVFTTSAQDSTKWQPRPSDPELEAEMLQRLLLRFRQPAQTTAATASPSAAAQATAAGAVTATVVADKAHLVKLADGGVERLAVDEPLDRAWRRVGLALDRGGFTVEDRDRTNGIYFVRFLDPEYEAKQREEQGLFSKLFGSDPKIEAPQFRVKLTEGGAGTDVTVLTSDGKPEASGTGNKILSLLYEQLR